MSLATQATNTYTGSVTNPLSTGEKIVLLRYDGSGINSTPTQIDNVTMTSTTTFSYSDVVSGGTYTYQWAKVNVFGQVQPFADYRVYDTAAPTVTLKQDANNDGVITAAEAGAGADKLTVEIGIPSRAMAGDSILVDNGSGSVETVTLTQADINNGTITVQIDTPADGNTADITAKFEDASSVNAVGSTTVNGNDSAVVDVNVPGDSNGDGVADKGPVVTINEDANNDGVITAGELQGDIDVSVAMPVNTSVGDTLVLTVNGTTQNVTVTQAIINNGYTFTVPNAGQGASVNVEAYVQDAVGQTSLTGSDTATLNLQTVGTPSIDIVAVDDIVNDSESQAGVTVSGSGTAGNTLTLTDGSGNVLGTTIITAGGTWQLPLTLAQVKAMGQGDETLTATASDNYGGSATVTRDIEIDTVAPSPGAVDAPDNTNDTTPTITASGGTPNTPISVVITDSAGNTQTVTTVSDNNGVWNVTPTTPLADGTYTVIATATDPAGNSSLASDRGSVDNTPPNGGNAPTVVITEDANNDGYISKTELNGKVDVQVSFDGSKVDIGDVVTVTDGNTTQTITINATAVNNGYVTASFTAPSDGSTINVSAGITDASGQATPAGNDSAKLDLSVDTGTLQLNNFADSSNPYVSGSSSDQVSNDNSYNLQVVGQEAGSTVQYQVFSGGKWVDTNAAQVNVADGEYTYRAEVTDVAGNVSYTNLEQVEVDTTNPSAPSNVALSSNGYKVTGTAEANSTVIVKDASGSVLGTATAGSSGSFTVNLGQYVAAGSSLKVSAMDVAGNESDATSIGYDNILKVYTDASDWNSHHGPAGYWQMNTSGGDDWLQIGNGAKNCWTLGTQGNIWNKNPAAGVSVIDTGDGNDRIDTGYGGGTGSMFAYTGVEMGAGNDIFNLKGDMVNDNYVLMGKGDDTMNVGGFMGTYTSVNMGAGDDSLTIGTDMLSGSRVSTGAGDDTFSMGGLMTLNSSVDLGSGDDVATYDHKTLDGHIDGGAGNDKLVLTHNDSDAPVAWWNWSNITGTHTGNIKGFETIEMKGIMAFDVRYKDLLNDSSREGALFIKGDSLSKVDLGSTNWNSDTAVKQNLSDTGGGSWSQTGSKVVDGVSYDVYHHSCAGNSTDNDVYVQQGIVVI